jgi:hypothetical protein
MSKKWILELASTFDSTKTYEALEVGQSQQGWRCYTHSRSTQGILCGSMGETIASAIRMNAFANPQLVTYPDFEAAQIPNRQVAQSTT